VTTRRIAALGAGNIGGTLGRKWVAAGHQVAFGLREPDGERARALRSELGDGARVATLADASARPAATVTVSIGGRWRQEPLWAAAAGALAEGTIGPVSPQPTVRPTSLHEMEPSDATAFEEPDTERRRGGYR
jgi:prephenate dehydrogenase